MTVEHRKCGVHGCGRKHYAKGMCQPHYMRVRMRGYADDHVPLKVAPGSCRAWVDEHSQFVGDDCLIWPFKVSRKSRPYVVIDGKREVAARYMCRVAHGPPPYEDMEAAHSCGNGHLGCLNPHHIRWATARENCLDRFSHGTMACAKLSEDDVRSIRYDMIGMRSADIAERFGISLRAVQSILSGKSWKHV